MTIGSLGPAPPLDGTFVSRFPRLASLSLGCCFMTEEELGFLRGLTLLSTLSLGKQVRNSARLNITSSIP